MTETFLSVCLSVWFGDATWQAQYSYNFLTLIYDFVQSIGHILPEFYDNLPGYLNLRKTFMKNLPKISSKHVFP